MRVGKLVEIWRYPVKSMGGESLEHASFGEGGLLGDRGWAVRDEVAGEIRGGKKLPRLMQFEASYREEPSADFVPHAVVRFPDGSESATDAPDAAARISAVLGREISLRTLQPASDESHYALSAPLNISEEGLREMFAREPGEPLPDLSNIPPEILGQLARFATPLGTHFDLFPVNLLTTNSMETLSRHNPKVSFDPRRFRPNLVIEADGDADFPEFDWCGSSLRVGAVEFACEIPCVRCGMTTQATAGLPKEPGVLRTIVRESNQNIGAYASVRVGGVLKRGDVVELVGNS